MKLDGGQKTRRWSNTSTVVEERTAPARPGRCKAGASPASQDLPGPGGPLGICSKTTGFWRLTGPQTAKPKGFLQIPGGIHFSTAPMAFLRPPPGGLRGVLVSRSPSTDGLGVFFRRPKSCSEPFRTGRAWKNLACTRFWPPGKDALSIHPMSS